MPFVICKERRVLNRTPSPSLRTLWLLAIMAGLCAPAQAALRTWTAAGPGLASNSANWQLGNVPVNGDDVNFNLSGPGNCTWDLAVTNISSFTVDLDYNGVIGFEPSAPLTFTGAFQIHGGTVEFRDTFGPFTMQAPVTVSNGMFHVGQTTVALAFTSSMTFTGGWLDLHDDALLLVNEIGMQSGSTFYMYDSSAVKGGPTLDKTSGPGLNIVLDGTVIITSGTFRGLATTGIVMGNSVNLVSISSVAFVGPLAAGTTIFNFDSAGTVVIATFTNVMFLDSNIAVNVRADNLVAPSRLTMRGDSGPRAGARFENDSLGLVAWPDHPISAIASPTVAYVYSLTVIAGTAQSYAAPISSVTVAIRRVSDDKWWNGAAFAVGPPNFRLASYSGGPNVVTWSLVDVSLDSALVDGETYDILVKAVDAAGRSQYPETYTNVFFDATAPTIALLQPAMGATLGTFPTISGTAADAGGSGLAEVQVRISSGPSFQTSWDGGSWVNNATLFNTASGLSSWTFGGVPSGVDLVPGTVYQVEARASDSTDSFSALSVSTFLYTGGSTISGSISYNGAESGTYFVAIGTRTQGGGILYSSLSLSSHSLGGLGAYSFSGLATPATYYVEAWKGSAQFNCGVPQGGYGAIGGGSCELAPIPVYLPASASASGIDINIIDEDFVDGTVSGPAPTGEIRFMFTHAAPASPTALSVCGSLQSTGTYQLIIATSAAPYSLSVYTDTNSNWSLDNGEPYGTTSESISVPSSGNNLTLSAFGGASGSIDFTAGGACGQDSNDEGGGDLTYSFTGNFAAGGARIAGSPSSQDLGWGIAIDSETVGGPYTYVLWLSTVAVQADTPAAFSVVKYDPAGVMLASASLSGRYADSFAMDAAHNVYIGEKSEFNNKWIRKLDKDLAFVASRVMSNDAVGNITRMIGSGTGIITCNDGGNGNTATVIRYDSSLVPVSTYAYVNSNVPYSRNCDGLALSDLGEPYALFASTDPNPAIVPTRRLVKLDAGLSFLADADLGNTLLLSSPYLAASGSNVFAVTMTDDGSELYVRKYDGSGNYLAVSATFTASAGFPFPGIAVGPEGDIYVSALDPVIGIRRLNGGLTQVNYLASGANRLAVSDSANVYGLGVFGSGDWDVKTDRLDLSGASPAFCGTSASVPGTASTIQGAVDLIPSSLSGNHCIAVGNGTYTEQVTIQNIATNGYRILISSGVGATVTVSPPAASTAAFLVMNASVTLQGIDIVPTSLVTYGINASSDNVTIASVNVKDAGGKITLSGMKLSGDYSAIAYSSITVSFNGAGGVHLLGAGGTVSYSSSTAGFNGVALYMSGVSETAADSYFYSANYYTLIIAGSNDVVTRSFFSNQGPTAMGGILGGGSHIISQSVFTGAGVSVGSDNNTFTEDFFINPSGTGLHFASSSSSNTVSLSTINGDTGIAAALDLDGCSSNTITQSYIANPGGVAVGLRSGAAYNTISQSTMTSSASGYAALQISTASFSDVLGSYLQGSEAALVSGATGTVVTGSVLVATGTTGKALYLGQGSNGLSVTSSILAGGPQGLGVFLDVANTGTLAFTSSTIGGGAIGLRVAPQELSAALEVSSLIFEDLTAGATAIDFTGGTFVATFTGVAFYATSAVNVNGSSLDPGSRITMLAASGSKRGPPFENDPSGYVDWPDYAPGGPVTFFNGYDVTPSFTGATAFNVPMLQVGIRNDAETKPLTSLQVHLFGDAPSSQVMASVFTDNDDDGLVSLGDDFLGTSGFDGNGSANVTFSPETITAVERFFLVTLSYNNIPIGSGVQLGIFGPEDFGLGADFDFTAFPMFSGFVQAQGALAANPTEGGYPEPSGIIPDGGSDTGLFISAGQTFHVEASGVWSDGGAPNDADGVVTTGGINGLKLGSLIGRIGGDAWFQLGVTSTMTAASSGNLYLAMNDTVYGDNSGSLSVSYNIIASTESRVWVGGTAGFETQASVAANWQGGISPSANERVVFDANAAFDCDWDLPGLTLGTLIVASDFTRTIRLASNGGVQNTLAVSTDAVIMGGRLELGGSVLFWARGELAFQGGSVLDMGPGGAQLRVKDKLTFRGGATLISLGAGQTSIERDFNAGSLPFDIKNATVAVGGGGTLGLYGLQTLNISSQARINQFDDVFLYADDSSAPALQLHGPASTSLEFNGWSFQVNSTTTVDASDVAAGSTVAFLNSQGPSFGSPFTTDPNQVVRWSPDGGGPLSSISGNIVFGASVYTPMPQWVLVSTDPAGGATQLGALQTVGPSTYFIGNLATPNTYYVFVFHTPTNKPEGAFPRGGWGHPGSYHSEPIFLTGDVSNIDVTLEDWVNVGGTWSGGNAQIGPVRVQAWRGVPGLSTSTLEGSAIGDNANNWSFDTKAAADYTIVGYVDVNNNSVPDSFESKGSSDTVEIDPAPASHEAIALTLSGGSAPPGGTVYLTTHTAHDGSITSFGAHALLKLELHSAGADSMVSALQVDYTGASFPFGGYRLQVFRDVNGSGTLETGANGDDLRGEVFLGPSDIGGTISWFAPDVLTAGSTGTYFVAIDMQGASQVPAVKVDIFAANGFGLSAGSMAPQSIYPVSSGFAYVKKDVPAFMYASPEGYGGKFMGLSVYAGQSLNISAVGLWRPDAGTLVGPAGSGDTGLETVLPSAKVGELIGRIQSYNGGTGGSEWFRVGAGTTGFIVPDSGELVLAMNDLVNAYYDNEGEVLVDFSISGSTDGAIAGMVNFTGGAAGPLTITADDLQGHTFSTVVTLSGPLNTPYIISDLPAGSYRVTAVVDGDPSQRADTGRAYDLILGSTITINLAISLGDTSISGTLSYDGVLDQGNFFIGATTHTDFQHGEPIFFGTVSQASTGSYTITGLPAPGVYYLIGFRDGNYSSKPDGAEPFGYFGIPGAGMNAFGASLSPISVSTGSSFLGKDFALVDNGQITGQVSLPSGPGGQVVLRAGRGTPGSPGFFIENQEFQGVPPSGQPRALDYSFGLLRPATDYSVFAFFDGNHDGQLNAGEPSFNSEAGLALPAGGNLRLDFALLAAQPPAPVAGFKGEGAAGGVNFSWNLSNGAQTYDLRRADNSVETGGIPHPTAGYFDPLTPNTSSQIRAIAAANFNGTSSSATIPTAYSLADAPLNLSTGAVSEASAVLLWSEAGNASGTLFELTRSTDGTDGVVVQTTSGEAALEASLAPGTTYYWRLRAVNGNGIRTAFSNQASTVTPASIAPSLAGLLAYAGRQSGPILIEASTSTTFFPRSFVSLPNVTSQRYYILVPGGDSYFLRAFVDADQDSMLGVGEDRGQTAAAFVGAGPVSGQDFAIAADTVPPAGPNGLQAAPGLRQVRLSWNAPVKNANNTPLVDLAGFQVQRTTVPGGAFQTIASVGKATTVYIDAAAVVGVNNVYRIVAFDLGQNLSAPTGSISATPAAGGTISGKVDSFTAATGILRIRLADSPAPNAPFLAETSLPSFSFTGLDDGTYFLRGFIDTNNDGRETSPGNPTGVFGGLSAAYPIQILGGNAVSGADVALCNRAAFGTSRVIGDVALSQGDCPARDKGPGHTTDLYSFTVGDGSLGSLGAGSDITLTMSSGFDNELILLGPNGNVVARDNSAGGTSSVQAKVFQPGVYLVEPTQFFQGDFGPYSLSLAVTGGFAGVVSGTVSYSGAQAGVTRVQLFDRSDASAFPILVATQAAPGFFSFEGLNDGTYFARAFLDVNGNTVRDPGEAKGAFGVSESSPTAVVIRGGANLTGAAPITLSDPAVGSVKGVILYSGNRPGPIRVEAALPNCANCFDSTVVASVSTGTGNSYVFSFLPPATSYIIRAYVDVNGDRGADTLEPKASSATVRVLYNSTTTVNLVLRDPGSGASGNAAIRGTIFYEGAQTGTIFVGFSKDRNFGFIDYVLNLSTQGPFIKSGITGGTSYYMVAFRDVNGNGNPDEGLGEPVGVGAPQGYEGTPSFASAPIILVPLSGAVTAFLTLSDPPSGVINGRVTYAGSAAVDQRLVVQTFVPMSQGNSYQSAILPRTAGVTSYAFALPFLAAATNYSVSAFLDANGNSRQDQGESFGQFGSAPCAPNTPCFGAPVSVSSGTGSFPTYGVDFGVQDPGGFGGGSGANTGRIQGHASYFGTQSGPVFIRFFNNSSFTGQPLFKLSVPMDPGPGDVEFSKAGLPFGTYYLDAFRDPSGLGFYNPTFHAHGVLNEGEGLALSADRNERRINQGDISDPGQGGSVNVFSGSFDSPAGVRFDGGATDIGAAITLDLVSSGGPFVYVSGISGQNDGVAALAVRLSSTGALLAQTTLPGNNVHQLLVDASGRVYNSGQIEPIGECDGPCPSLGTLGQYDADLNLLQTVVFDNANGIEALAFSGGSIYAVGAANSGGAGGFVFKLDPDDFGVGTSTGSFTFPDCGFCSGRAGGIGVDGSGNVYALFVTNGEQNGVGRRGVLVKFDSGLSLIAQADVTGLNLPFNNDGVRMRVSAAGDIYLSGVVDGQSEARTFKFSSSLVQTASASFGPVIMHFGGGVDNLQLASDGGVYESWESPDNGGDYVVVRYDANLNLLNTKTFDGFNGAGEDFPFALAVQDSSNVFVAGGVNNGRNLDWAIPRLNMNEVGAVSAAGADLAITTTSATRAIYGRLLYGGTQITSGTVRALLLPLGSDVPVRFSSAAFSASSLYLFNNLADGYYRISAFIDVNGNFIPEAGEPIGFSVSTGVYFSGTTQPDSDLVLCDRQSIVQGAELHHSLSASDCPAVDHNGAAQKLYTFVGRRGQPVTIAMDGENELYDTFLNLYGPNGALLTSDDESGGNGNAAIKDFILPYDGLYTIGAAVFAPGVFGDFKLSFLGSSGSLGSIAGRIDYTGSQGGDIFVGLFKSIDFSSTSLVSGQVLLSTNVFAFDGLATGTTYYLGAFIDLDSSGEPTDGEDGGVFGLEGVPSPIFLQNGQNVGGLAVLISPSTAGAAAQGFISGSVDYAGTRFAAVRLEFWSKSDFSGRPAAVRELPSGPGSYDASVPGGVAYYVRAFMDLTPDRMPNPDEPIGVYSRNNQGADSVFVPVAGSVAGSLAEANITLRDPGASEGGQGFSGEGTASVAPSTAPGNHAIAITTITFTVGAHGIAEPTAASTGGVVGFSVPPGLASPESVTAAVLAPSTATISGVTLNGPSAFVSVTGGGGLQPGQKVEFYYSGVVLPCDVSTATFNVASAQNALVGPQPLFAGSPSIRQVLGSSYGLYPVQSQLSMVQGVRSPALTLNIVDECFNEVRTTTPTAAALDSFKFDALTGGYVHDPDITLTTSPTVAPTATISVPFALGISSRVFYVVSTSTGLKSVGGSSFFPNGISIGLAVLPGNALTAPSVSTVPFSVGRSSTTITPNSDKDADQAFFNFTMGDAGQEWHIMISSTPFKATDDPSSVPAALWDLFGTGQPGPGEIAWDGRYNPWLNEGIRVPSGLYYARIEVGGTGGIHDDRLKVRVDVPQVTGTTYDAGLKPNPRLGSVRIDAFGPNGNLFTESDALGLYRMPGTVAGDYQLKVSREDYLPVDLKVTLDASGIVSTFTVVQGSTEAPSITASGALELRLSRSPTLLVVPSLSVGFSTQAVDQWGDLQVRSSGTAVEFSLNGRLRLPAGTTTFDDGGLWDTASAKEVFRTQMKFNVAVGTYTVEAHFGGFSSVSTTVYVGADGAVLNLASFARKSTVSGQVIVPANPGGLFISINAVPTSTSTLASGGFGGVTLAAGQLSSTYTVTSLDAGSYRLRANVEGFAAVSSGPITVPDATDVVGVDLPAFNTGAQILGTVTVAPDTTGRTLYFNVNAWSPGSSNFGSTNVVVAGGGAGLAIPYTISGLDANTTYQLMADLKGSDQELEVLEGLPLSKYTAGAVALDFTFVAASGTIVGSITLPAGSTDFINVDLFGLTVDAARPDKKGKVISELGAHNLPGFACTANGLPAPGGYCPAGNSSATFMVQGLNTETDDLTFTYKTTGDTQKLRVSVVNGSTTTIVVDLAGQTFSIAGTIVNQISHQLFNTNAKIVANAPYIAPVGFPANLSSSTARVVAIKQDLDQYSVAISTVFDPATVRVGYLTASGTFTISNVPAGVYFVRATGLRACTTCPFIVPPVGKTVLVSANVSGLSLVLRDGYSLSGSISLEDGIKDTRIFDVSVFNPREELVASTVALLGDSNLNVKANSVGYAFANLPPDDYTLIVQGRLLPIKYVGRPLSLTLQTNLANQNVTMQRAAYIIGRLKDANTGELITRNNITMLASNFQIAAKANPWLAGGFVVAPSSVAGRPIEADGYFRVGPLLPSVSYDVTLAQTGWDPRFLAQGSQNYTPVTLSGVTPEPAQFKDVGVISLNQGQSLTGTVRQSTTTGVALGNIKITAKPSFGDSGIVIQTYTNGQGKYSVWVSSFLSNQYDVTAAPREGNTASNGLIYGEVTRTKVSLLATTTADFLLEPLLSSVTGQVVVEDAATGGELSYPFGATKGFPAAAINLQLKGVIATKSALGDIEAVTDGSRRFRVPGLSTGTYALKATSLGYAVFNATVTTTATSFVMYTGSNTPSNYLPGNIITLRRGATVTGKIVKSDGKAPNDSEVAGVAAANFSQGEYVVGSIEIDKKAKTVSGYTISGFKPGISYDLVILPADNADDIIFPPEGSGISFTTAESTATKNITLTFAAVGVDCAATAKALGNKQFQIKIDCSKALRNTVGTDNDLAAILSVSTFNASGAAIVAPNGTGQFLGSDKTMSSNRRKLTAIYRAGASETGFSVRLRAASSTVDPKTGANFTLDKVFDFFVGVDSNVNERFSNIKGGKMSLTPSAEDELLGSDERTSVGLQPGTFAIGNDSDAESSTVASATTSVTLGLSKARDQSSLDVLYMRQLGYVPAAVASRSNASLPAEMAAAMSALAALRQPAGASPSAISPAGFAVSAVSTAQVNGINPLSSFYSIFLPAGIRHQLKQNADLTFSYDTRLSTSGNPDNFNVWFFNAVLGKYVKETTNRRVDTVNKTITVAVNHFSTFIVLDGAPATRGAALVATDHVMAANFPNPSDCRVHHGLAKNAALLGAGGNHDPFRGTMIRYILPPGPATGTKIRIYTLSGELVRVLEQGQVTGSSTNYFPWDCANASGRTVASGVYIGEVEWGGQSAYFKIAIVKGSGL